MRPIGQQVILIASGLGLERRRVRVADVHPHGPSRSVVATGYVVPRKRASLDGLVTVKGVTRSRVTSGRWTRYPRRP